MRAQACTSRNSNSSRFGKCVRLGIDASHSGALLGGQVYTYLLEKSRVVRKARERLFSNPVASFVAAARL